MRICSQRRNARGSVTVELALVGVVCMTLTWAGLEYGRLMHSYAIVDQSARAAARYLATASTVDQAAKQNAQKIAVFGNLTSTTPLIPGLSVDKVKVCSPTVCDAGLSAGDYTGLTLGANTLKTDLVVVRVSGVAFTSAMPNIVGGVTMRDIQVVLPRLPS